MGPLPSSQVAPIPKDLPFRVVSKTIGQGAYAFIRKAVPPTASTPVIAVKFINKDHAYRTGRLKPSQIQHEVTLHSYLGRHHNVIQYFSHGEDNLYTWIAMELAEGGDLFDKIEADAGVSEDVAHLYFTQLINAVGYMHSKGVAHRDIKPENLLLSIDGDLKLSDFGLAALFSNHGKKRLCSSVCGSPPYIAPEIVAIRKFKANKSPVQGYEPNVSDIWSCGIVLFVLLVGNTPWDEPTKNSFEFNEYMETNGRTTDELWKKIPPDIASLLRGMLKLDPKSRFTLDEVRTHPWYTRANPHLATSGRIDNPIRLATQMLESLHINFDTSVSASQTDTTGNGASDLMDVESGIEFASTQPETAGISDVDFEWERPPRLSITDGISASQPTDFGARPSIRAAANNHVASAAQRASQNFVAHLADSPALTQFSSTPAVPISLTQAARRFGDIVPPYSMTRFFSPLSFSLLLPLLAEALHRLGVPVSPLPASALEGKDSETWIRVKTVDGRQQGLNGVIVVERFGAADVGTDVEADMCEVRFTKIRGDPLEWRRFFKKCVVLCKEGVVVPN